MILNKFKRKGSIIVECNFPRFNDEDREFLYRTIKDDLIKSYGTCYNIEIKKGLPDKVIITEGKKNRIKERAISIEIYKMIKKFK